MASTSAWRVSPGKTNAGGDSADFSSVEGGPAQIRWTALRVTRRIRTPAATIANIRATMSPLRFHHESGGAAGPPVGKTTRPICFLQTGHVCSFCSVTHSFQHVGCTEKEQLQMATCLELTRASPSSEPPRPVSFPQTVHAGSGGLRPVREVALSEAFICNQI